MNLSRKVFSAAAGAFAATLAVLAIASAPASATGPTTPPADSTYEVQVINTPDDGCPAWARDTFKRTTVIHEIAEGKYKVTITDDGTFLTNKDADSPNEATKMIRGNVTGKIHGTGYFEVTGKLKNNPDTSSLNNGQYACKNDVPKARTTGAWPLRFFKDDAQTSGIKGWTWTYATDCEKMVQTEAGIQGNIKGKECPSPSPSSPRPSMSTSKSSGGPGGGAGSSSSPVPASDESSLPVTGSSIVPLVAGGVALIIIGGFAYLVTRRRRLG